VTGRPSHARGGRARLVRCLQAQDGQFLPVFAAILFMLLIVGITFLQVGAAATFKSRVQTAADAAALAGEVQVKREIEAAFPEGLSPAALQATLPAICAQAEVYASRNGADVTSCTLDMYDVKVVVKGNDQIPSGLSGRKGATGEAHARASLGVSYTGGLGFGGGGGAGGPSGGGNCMTDGEIAKVADAAGVKVRSDSALRQYCGNGQQSGVDVRDLKPAMQVALVKAEDELGHGIALNSGFRTVAYQRVLCARVSGPCAPPGQSMHNFGMAVDVANPGEMAGVAKAAGLCQPLPSNDAVHFSLASDVECAGNAGATGGGAFGTPLGGLVTYAIKLVPWEGGDFNLPSFGGESSNGPWAIPWDVVACESGGRNLPPNSAGASGYYQFLPSTWQWMGGSTPQAYQASKEEQDRLAAKLWNMPYPGGPHHWVCAQLHGYA
jgi:hypothetical protein